jgi:uncharacterized protein YdiU (UPF0061 family)
MESGNRMAVSNLRWNFDNSYARLPTLFFSRHDPAPVRAPHLIALNQGLASQLGLDLEAIDRSQSAAIFSGNLLPSGADPIALAYSGCQFGYFTTLGDGRAILLGEIVAPDGRRFDLQFKGSGRTVYSRGGDGLAALGPMLREYLISEAMHALGIPTTRSLAVVATGQAVYRERPLPGAVLTRVAASHIRVGTFEHFAASSDVANLRILADYTIRRHYPEALETENPCLSFLEAVLERQIDLVARWLGVGFVHGVMNTDNMAISGETIDYGPCAFIDNYDPQTVFSSIDHQGRYAFCNQPRIAQWNLARFAETLLPLIDPDRSRALEMAGAVIRSVQDRFQLRWLEELRAKLGLFNAEAEDAALAQELLDWMHRHSADYTNTWRQLPCDPAPAHDEPAVDEYASWHRRWRERLARQETPVPALIERMQRKNPAIVPRNLHVEQALAAAELGDISFLERLVAALADPFSERPGIEAYRQPLDAGGRCYRTFCGT